MIKNDFLKLPTFLNRRMTHDTKIISNIEYQQMITHIISNLDKKTLENGVKKELYFDSITEQQKFYHQIDACAVLIDNTVKINPDTWPHTSYYISDKFDFNGVRVKIFIQTS